MNPLEQILNKVEKKIDEKDEEEEVDLKQPKEENEVKL